MSTAHRIMIPALCSLVASTALADTGNAVPKRSGPPSQSFKPPPPPPPPPGTSSDTPTPAQPSTRPFVWVQGGGYAGPTFYESTSKQPSEQLGVAADFFARATAGVGFWEGEGVILPGWGESQSTLNMAITVGGWFRLESAMPFTEEAMGRSFGGTICLVESTRDHQFLATILDLGVRQSLDQASSVRQGADGQNLQQFSLGFSEQVPLFGEYYLGPAARINWGTDELPTGVSVGLEISSVL